MDRDGEFPDRTDALEIFRAKEVTIEADPAMEVQYDGEATGLSTPFSARILPRATRLFISDEGYFAVRAIAIPAEKKNGPAGSKPAGPLRFRFVLPKPQRGGSTAKRVVSRTAGRRRRSNSHRRRPG